jgi:very-short-patch-repair endonuclease
MTLNEYIENISKRYNLGNSTEHTFRGDLQQLLESIVPDISATNEPKRIKCGSPDFVLMRKEIPVGFIEAKDVGIDLNHKSHKEQFDRYKSSLNNLIFTDYLDFHLYIDGKFITSIKIGEIINGVIVPLTENFAAFTNLIKDFASRVSQTITSSKRLAEMMAGKARILSDVIEKSLLSDVDNQEDSTLKDQMTAFKDILIHDITEKDFADVYAQTIAYGMFAARLHDKNLDTFSRQEAAELIPKSNPFLRKLFGYIAGPEIDDRIKWIVDSLADIFRATDIVALLKNFGKSTQTFDPIIHFYETFLSEYDPKLRKARGVWYTPEPVVNFIVRAVDDILKTEFNLPQGLADTSKTKIKVKTQSKDARYAEGVKEVEKEVHRVQILDPATGTGTFLAEVIKQIHAKFAGQQGIWSNYVENNLIPRINGFELLMASYAMAHLKIDLLLSETGYRNSSFQPPRPRNASTPPLEGGELNTKNSPPVLGGVDAGRGGKRLQIYLTNSLEEHHPDTGTLFARWLSDEANEANHIKRDTPVMCVIGNPPYSGESQNKGKWIMDLMEDYKKEPEGKEKLKERNPKWINDDYVKFLRYGQHFIESNGEGILAFINPHGFLDNPTFRGMRWNLLKTYDKIYTIDLHGNSKKKEVCPDGSPDVNVFDIMQGVSINIFVKTGKKKANELGKVFHFDLYGKRDFKYDFLIANSLKSIDYKELPNVAPNYFFVSKDFDQQKIYDEGFLVNEIIPLNNVGIVTARDGFSIHKSKDEVKKIIEEFLVVEDETARIKFNLGKDARDWQVHLARLDLQTNYPNKGNFVKISYRPFDERNTYFTGKSRGFHCYPRNEVMQHFLKGENIGLNFIRPMSSKYEFSIFISKNITDQCSAGNKSAGAGISFIAPLYLYPEANEQIDKAETTPSLFSDTPPLRGGELVNRVPNLNTEIVKQIADKLSLEFVNEKPPRPRNASTPPWEGGELLCENFAPIDLLDYIYAVLHSPIYREKYKEFLKIDFPRVPYPQDAETFWKLVNLGGEIRQIHLLESAKVTEYITQYPIDGDNVVGKVRFEAEPPRPSDTTLLKGEELSSSSSRFQTQFETKSSPPVLGGVDSFRGRGGNSQINNLPYLKTFRKELRKNLTPAEAKFWTAIKNKQFEGRKFRRQHSVGNYILDFYCPAEKLAIELDGQVHFNDSAREYDYERKLFLEQFGIKVLRFENKRVFEDLEWMLDVIRNDFGWSEKAQPPRPSDTPPLEGGELSSANLMGQELLGKVWINETQYFDNVPEIAWQFYIGGYQPAQKWLKDRKERTLNFEDIFHYQKIIVALCETDRLMKEIDKIELDK